MVLVGSAVAVTQETFKAVLAPQLTNNLVQSLTVERVVIHRKGRIADGGEQGCICVLSGRKYLLGKSEDQTQMLISQLNSTQARSMFRQFTVKTVQKNVNRPLISC